MQDALIVIDMQNDFIDGSLGTPEAQEIVLKVGAKIENYIANGKKVFYTRDTHFDGYLGTLEGKKLPVEHCIFGREGWKLHRFLPVLDEGDNLICKTTFGYLGWKEQLNCSFKSYEICGLCTDICVVSNALILRAMYPNDEIVCDASCCAGTTPEKHKAALEVMKSCQIDVINE